MSRRSDQRREAVFALYQQDVTGQPSADALVKASPFTRELVEGVESRRATLDEEISRRSQGWSLERIGALERNILRVGLYELRHSDDVPAEVAIDEAVSLAHEFCGAEAPGFVNGILGAATRAEAEL
jgi:transcription antitermination protein NusB